MTNIYVCDDVDHDGDDHADKHDDDHDYDHDENHGFEKIAHCLLNSDLLLHMA